MRNVNQRAPYIALHLARAPGAQVCGGLYYVAPTKGTLTLPLVFDDRHGACDDSVSCETWHKMVVDASSLSATPKRRTNTRIYARLLLRNGNLPSASVQFSCFEAWFDGPADVYT
jgi:hypothetical protein